MGAGELENEIIALETGRTRAWLDRDAAALAALLADDFLEINVLGRLSKRALLDDLFPRLRLVSLSPSEWRLTPLGQDAASLSYACEETVEIGGRTISGRFNVASTWRRAPQGWQLVLWQITPVEA